MSAHRYLYCVAVQHEEDINEELLEWIHEAHDKKAFKPSDSHDNEWNIKNDLSTKGGSEI